VLVNGGTTTFHPDLGPMEPTFLTCADMTCPENSVCKQEESYTYCECKAGKTGEARKSARKFVQIYLRINWCQVMELIAYRNKRGPFEANCFGLSCVYFYCIICLLTYVGDMNIIYIVDLCKNARFAFKCAIYHFDCHLFKKMFASDLSVASVCPSLFFNMFAM